MTRKLMDRPTLDWPVRVRFMMRPVMGMLV